MKCLVLCCSLVILCLQLVNAEPPGVCNVVHTVRREKHVVDREKQRWVVIPYEEHVTVRQCCEGYRNSTRLGRLICEPVCEQECINSNCEAPNLCVCEPYHVMVNNSTSTCKNICDSCVNSACAPFEEADAPYPVCICKAGYQKEQDQPHVCSPICDPPCQNGTCTAPGECQCYEGFAPVGGSHVCKPTCKDQCLFGDCTDVDECTCYAGYTADMEQQNICVPQCSVCENGFCAEPDRCECHSGFEPSPDNQFKCVPQSAQRLLLSEESNCAVNISKAIQHDKTSNCYKLKDEMIILESQCGALQFLDTHECRVSDSCQANLKCSKIANNTIHCGLMDEVVFANSSNVTLTEMDWQDVTIELSLFPGGSETNVTDSHRRWELRPTNDMTVCGTLQFGVVIREISSNTATETKTPLYVRVFLILLSCIAFLLAGSGVAVFMWRRHRRLNDPLNYKGTMKGYRVRQGEGERPDELIPDDTEECEDAHL